MPTTPSATPVLRAFRRSLLARRVRFLLTLLVFACAACSPSQPTTTQTTTATPDASLLIAQAQQADAPALALNRNQLLAVWVGGDERGIHQDARLLSGDTTVTLPLPPTRPFGQALVAGVAGQTHLLWLDADANDRSQNKLYAAVLGTDLSVLRGPVAVSEGAAFEFSSVTDGAGGLWTAWSGGAPGEPRIYVRRSDDGGRPLLQTTTIDAGEYPALVRATDGGVWLFWLSGGELRRQQLDQPNAPAQALTGTISLAQGDQLANVRAALDSTSAYFFWNVTRANGVSETWWTAGALDTNNWRQPQRLTSETGRLLRWTAPVSNLPEMTAAAASDAGLGMVTFGSGSVTGYKLIVPGVQLLGMPTLVVSNAANYALAWAAPGIPFADLRQLTVPR